MTPDEQLDLLIRSTEKQIELTHEVMEKHLDESDRIHARQTSQALVQAASNILANPTSATP